MKSRPVKGHHKYVTIDETAKARDAAIADVQEYLSEGDPGWGDGVPALVVALTHFKVDYREIADGVGVSGLAILQVLADSGLEAEVAAAEAYRAGLVTEREAIERYRDLVLAEQRQEALRLRDAGHQPTAVARDVGVTRGAVRAWWSERDGADATTEDR